MSFTLRQLQFFVAAAEQGSVSGAARALSISQSSVTEAIRALEDDLGVTLFDRQARGLQITHKGSAFLRHAQTILGDVARARDAFKGEAAQATGRLSLGVTSLVAGYVLSDILARVMPEGYFLEVTPGTAQVTLGGAIANDVHGLSV